MLPKVAIVGRPNVGKSSLFNLLVGRRVSIVDPTAGVTRDRVSSEVELPPTGPGEGGRYCELIDTGGYGIYSGEEADYASLTADVERQIDIAVAEASLILFVVDGRTGVTALDEEVAQRLRQYAAEPERILLLANKVDHEKHEPGAMEATALGFGEPMCVSATTGLSRRELLEAIADRLGEADAEPGRAEMELAIVGKRNAGKSTFVNTLAGEPRVITSELAGTTRDSVDVHFRMDDREFIAIDTAGLRKRKSMQGDDLEYYSLHRALRSIRRADVVMLLIDATQRVSHVDKKLSQEITEHYKPCVIVINKWDLVPEDMDPEKYHSYLTDQLRGLDYCPIVFVSAMTGEGVQDAVRTAGDLHEQARQRVGTGELNRLVERLLQERGPSPKLGQQARIYYATQPAAEPPTIALFVNDPKLFDERYRRYLINRFREHLPFEEVPIKLLVRPRRAAAKTG